jgi:plasmid stabilization system protein ParE
VARLKRFPHTGTFIAKAGTAELREIYCGSYRIIFRNTPGHVDIVTVRHGARLPDENELP